jgi:hypothetical protein
MKRAKDCFDRAVEFGRCQPVAPLSLSTHTHSLSALCAPVFMYMIFSSCTFVHRLVLPSHSPRPQCTCICIRVTPLQRGRQVQRWGDDARGLRSCQGLRTSAGHVQSRGQHRACSRPQVAAARSPR